MFSLKCYITCLNADFARKQMGLVQKYLKMYSKMLKMYFLKFLYSLLDPACTWAWLLGVGRMIEDPRSKTGMIRDPRSTSRGWTSSSLIWQFVDESFNLILHITHWWVLCGWRTILCQLTSCLKTFLDRSKIISIV